MSLIRPEGNKKVRKTKLSVRKISQDDGFQAEVKRDLYYIEEDMSRYAGGLVPAGLFRKLCYLYAKKGTKGTYYVDDELFVTDSGDEWNISEEDVKKV